MKQTAAVLWTGGKDCALAFYKAQKAGYEITHLVTFVPENPDFKAHSFHLMQQQINAIGLPHLIITVTNPMKESYENAIQDLKHQQQIETLITGDIDEVDNHNNWIEQCCKKSGMKVYNPLWKKNREDLLKETFNLEFNTIFTLVKKPFFNASWVGKTINYQTLKQLKELNIDVCGENGEYHTMILKAPYFKNNIKLPSFNIEETKDYYYLKF